jgi:glycosyl transferase family 87
MLRMSFSPAASAIAGRHPALIRALALGLAILSFSLLANTLYKNRGRFERADFGEYYAWWLEYRLGIDPYHPGPKAPLAPKLTTIGFCNYTPAFVMLFSPMARLPVKAAYWIWLAIQIATLIGAILMLLRQIRPPPGPEAAVAIVALALMFPQVHATLYEAQFTFLLLLILAGAWIFDRNGRAAVAGLMLALAALLKIYPAALGGLFLVRRRFRLILWASILTLLGILLTGLGRWSEFLVYGVPVVDTPHWLTQPRALAIWCNVYSAILTVRGGAAQSGFGWATGGVTAVLDLAVVAGAVAATLKAPEDRETQGLCFGLWLVVALLISPVTWLHELPLLLPLYLFASAAALHGGIGSRAGFWLLAIGLAGFVATYFWAPLREMRLYFIMTGTTFVAACVLVNFVPRAGADEPEPAHGACTRRANRALAQDP